MGVVLSTYGVVGGTNESFELVVLNFNTSRGGVGECCRELKVTSGVVGAKGVLGERGVRRRCTTTSLLVFPSAFSAGNLIIHRTTSYTAPSLLIGSSYTTRNIASKVGKFLYRRDTRDVFNGLYRVTGGHRLVRAIKLNTRGSVCVD